MQETQILPVRDAFERVEAMYRVERTLTLSGWSHELVMCLNTVRSRLVRLKQLQSRFSRYQCLGKTPNQVRSHANAGIFMAEQSVSHQRDMLMLLSGSQIYKAFLLRKLFNLLNDR